MFAQLLNAAAALAPDHAALQAPCSGFVWQHFGSRGYRVDFWLLPSISNRANVSWLHDRPNAGQGQFKG